MVSGIIYHNTYYNGAKEGFSRTNLWKNAYIIHKQIHSINKFISSVNLKCDFYS
jgi:hypothetical protein